MKQENVKPIEDFLKLENINSSHLVTMKQKHTSNTQSVTTAGRGKITDEIDGLVTDEVNVFLGVNIADCVPIFLYDPIQKIVSVVHAGWRGTLGNIAKNTIVAMQKLDSMPKNIFVAIGPHIGGCCYNINKDRAQQFLTTFNKNDRIVFQNNDQWFLDLGEANKEQLLNSGVLFEHIDSPIACTSCQNDTFFSYRKDAKETFGEMLGIIGMKN